MEPTEQLQEIQAIMRVLTSRLEPIELIHTDEREIISYRLAELFSTARSLYTEVLPHFIDMSRADADEVFEAFGEVRMNLLHIKDLIEEFEEAFLLSLGTKLEEQDTDSDEVDDVEPPTAPPKPAAAKPPRKKA